MKRAHAYRAIAVWAAVWFAVVSSMGVSLCAQETAAPSHTGFPQDWSQQHIVFSRDGLAQHPDLLYREPRVLQQAMQRWQTPNFGAFDGSESVPAADNSGPHSDWNLTAFGSRLSINAYPSKYSINPAAPPDCTNDYVVFGLDTTSTGTLANLVALNNLYVDPADNGFCPGKAPVVMFAYDITTQTGGHIVTSPVISVNGQKIAFVESVPASAGTAQSIFHVVTWAANLPTNRGAIGAAVPPTNDIFFSLPLAKNDITSSPWVDYALDIAYVGSANGAIYKITGVFKGTPTLDTTAPWPVTVIANSALTSPVLDSNLNMLMVGAANGNLYQIDASTGVVSATHLAVGQGNNHAILAAPIVDVTNGVTFVVSSDCGNVCATGVPYGAVLVEADTASVTLLAEASIGQGSFLGPPNVNLYQPALDNNYYNSPSTGSIHLCGTGPTDTTPWQYAFGFTVPVAQPILNPTALVAQPIPTTPMTSTGTCSGWTEFFNPNIGVGGTDFFFFGLTMDCTAAGAAGGCVEELAINGGTPTLTPVKINGGPTAVVVDNYANSATYPQASSIYFMARSVNTAYKYTQNGLQ